MIILLLALILCVLLFGRKAVLWTIGGLIFIGMLAGCDQIARDFPTDCAVTYCPGDDVPAEVRARWDDTAERLGR